MSFVQLQANRCGDVVVVVVVVVVVPVDVDVIVDVVFEANII